MTLTEPHGLLYGQRWDTWVEQVVTLVAMVRLMDVTKVCSHGPGNIVYAIEMYQSSPVSESFLYGLGGG